MIVLQQGDTPVHHAVYFHDNPILVKMLLDKGFDINAQDGVS